MIRKYNYTGRIKIPHDRVTILQKSTNGLKSFEAKLSLNDFSFPDSAKIYIEPYFKSSFMRFSFGTIARTVTPSNTDLVDIPVTDRVLYRIKIIDESSKAGLILGFCDEISATTSDANGGRISLLPVDFNDLGNRVWKLDFREEGPVLSVNYEKNIENIRDTVVNDPKFQSLVYPEVVRQIAFEIASNTDFDWDEQGTEWENKWVQFFKDTLGINHQPQSIDEKDITLWSDDVSEAFSRIKNVISLIKTS